MSLSLGSQLFQEGVVAMQKRWFIFFVLGLGSAFRLHAQVSPSTGAIQGSVLDQTGAIMPERHGEARQQIAGVQP